MRRTIMIFPEFENSHVIDKIRAKYDPLAGLVRPHITLVFPFEGQFGNDTLKRVLDRRLSGIEPFELSVKGVSTQKGQFGNCLLLDIVKGADEIRKIHDILYANEFRYYDLGFEYRPHITVGKLPSKELLDEAFEEIRDMEDEFNTTVRKISVEMIGENEESIILIEKTLGEEEASEETVVFDTAKEEDIDELIRLRLLYMKEDFGTVSERDEKLMRRNLPDYFRRKLGKELVAFVARDQGRLIAAAYLLIIEKPASVLLPHGLMGEVLSVYTEERYRGKGICSHLIEDLIAYGKNAGLDRIDLKATDDGYNVYKNKGFDDSRSRYKPMDLIL
ncbi:MAG: GNAT family N-acetyltransferase [Clostridiales bacterium]|nr:GNAT family N-acetyltransferase [Clostridiales bacterium]